MNLYDKLFKDAQRYFQSGEIKRAEPIIHQLVLEQYKNPEVYQMIASIYYDQGKFSKAIQMLRTALEIDPTYNDARVGLCIILNDLGRYDEAKQVFAEAQNQLDHKNNENEYLDERLSQKHEEMADLYFQFKKYKDALQAFEKAKQLSKRKEALTIRLVETLMQMGDSDRAIRELKTVVRNSPTYLDARMKLGVILYNKKDYSGAKEQWEHILMRDSGHPEARRYLQMLSTQQERSL